MDGWDCDGAGGAVKAALEKRNATCFDNGLLRAICKLATSQPAAVPASSSSSFTLASILTQSTDEMTGWLLVVEVGDDERVRGKIVRFWLQQVCHPVVQQSQDALRVVGLVEVRGQLVWKYSCFVAGKYLLRL